MKKTLLTRFIASTVLLGALTACGGNPATGPEPAGPTPDPAQTATEQMAAPSDAPSVEGLVDSASGSFSFVIDDATGDVVLPAEAPEDVEALRTELGEDAVSYAIVTVQNPDGALTLNLGGVTISTPEGQELEFRTARAVVEEWGATANGGESNPDVIGLVEEYPAGALPGQTTEILLIGSFPEVPDLLRTVTVQPADGREPVEAMVRPES